MENLDGNAKVGKVRSAVNNKYIENKMMDRTSYSILKSEDKHKQLEAKCLYSKLCAINASTNEGKFGLMAFVAENIQTHKKETKEKGKDAVNPKRMNKRNLYPS